MAVFHEATAGDSEVWNFLAFPTFDVRFRHPKASGGRRAVLVAVSFRIWGAAIGDVTRGASYAGATMTSLGIQEFNDDDYSWLEVFGLLDAPPGGDVRVVISDDSIATRSMRATSISYTGVESFGTVTESYGTGTELSAAATAPSAGKAVQFFGAKAGLTGYNHTQRYLNSSGIALAGGDVDGDGEEQTFEATRASSGTWAGVSVILNPADLVGSSQAITAEPALLASGRRLPRPGIPRRVVYDIQPEA